MFKALELWWNARTPRYLQSRTKENLIFQIILAVLVMLGLIAKDIVQDYREAKARNKAIYNK